MVFPVVLGSGKRVFGETSEKKPMRLANSKMVGDGVAILVYRRAGAGYHRGSGRRSGAAPPPLTPPRAKRVTESSGGT